MCWSLYLLFLVKSMVEEKTATEVIATGDALSILMLYWSGQHTDKVKAWNAQPGRGRIKVYDPSVVTCDTRAIEKVANPRTLIIIDYVGLMRTVTGARSIDDYKYAASISNTLKEIALRHKVPILAAAQLNREAEGKAKPSLTNFAQTDALGQDADFVYFLRGKEGSKVRELRALKYRHGPDGQLWHVEFQPGVPSFAEISKDRAEELIELERQYSVDM